MSKNQTGQDVPNQEIFAEKANTINDPLGPFIPKITLHQMNSVMSDVEGKLLTVIDASVVDPKQSNAIKSLVRQFIWKDFDIVREWYYRQTEGEGCSFPFREAVAVDR